MLKEHYTKSERHELMKLAPIVYDAELHELLESLDAKFVKWRNGELAGEELHQAIHHYHQKDARHFWSMYQHLRRDQVVARGVSLGLIQADQLSGTLQAKLANTIGWYKYLLERENEPPELLEDEDDEQ